MSVQVRQLHVPTTRILVVEDDAAFRNSLRSILEHHGYLVRTAGDGSTGARELEMNKFDLVLLDIGLPFVDGWRLLGAEKRRWISPVIVISGRTSEQDKVRALDMGADDYLVKPFGADELTARIRALLRRTNPTVVPGAIAWSGNVTVDLGNGVALRNGVEVRLSPTEYGLLAALARHAGQVIDHRTLLREVWGPSHFEQRNYLHTFVRRLRSKLEPDPNNPTIIVTVGSRGYRFAGDLSRPGVDYS
jgi:two-component system KDP operon response regulator KdpE